MRRAEGDPPGLLRVEVAAAERPCRARRGAGGADIPGQGRGARHLRRAQGVHAAARARGAHVAQARGAHHARARLAGRHPRVRQAPLGREARLKARIGCRSGGAQVRGRRPRRGVVRRHHLREDQAGLAVPGARDGRMVAAHSGLSMGPNITAELADEALKMALARRNPPEGCVHHSDHGSQYVSLLLSKTMRENGVRPSMGSISSPWDNAAMESLMGIVKSECVHARTYATREEAALDLLEYIEVVYNRARIHSALGYMSPAEFEEANWPKEGSRPKAA